MENRTKGIVQLLAGPLVFLFLQLFDAPEALGDTGYQVFAVTVWMAIWWVSEAVHISVTALLPIFLFPLLGILEIDSVTASYGHKYIFLYMGGFMIAIAIERWNLHKRIALSIIKLLGTDIKRILLGFMLATAFLSMWISNTATSVMMLPIGIAIVTQFQLGTGTNSSNDPFGKALMLAIAYSASIGGIATLIGTPPNLVLAGILEEVYKVKISFTDWFIYGFPVAILLFIACFFYLSRYAFRFEHNSFPGGREKIELMYRELGPMGKEEKWVLVVFILTAVCWMTRSFLEVIFPGIDDTVIAIAGSTLLFIIPSGEKRPLITWEEAVKLPWGIMILFGGGIALAKGFTTSGLAEYIAFQMTDLKGLSLILLILVLVAMVNFLTEMTSNLATTAMLLPILAPMALAFDIHPFMIMVSVTVAASCAFMLPVATPPNAVVFGSGYLKVRDMMKSGLYMNLFSILLVTLFTFFILPLLWDLSPNEFPDMFRSVTLKNVNP